MADMTARTPRTPAEIIRDMKVRAAFHWHGNKDDKLTCNLLHEAARALESLERDAAQATERANRRLNVLAQIAIRATNECNAITEAKAMEAELAAVRCDLVSVSRDRQLMIEAADSRIGELKTALAAAEADYKRVIDDVFDGMECDPSCDSYGHTDTCCATHGPAAVRKLRERIAAVEAELVVERQWLAHERAKYASSEETLTAERERITGLELVLGTLVRAIDSRTYVLMPEEVSLALIAARAALSREP